MNMASAIRQSYIAIMAQITVMEIPLAKSCGTIWLKTCSLVATSSIRLVVSSDRSLELNRLIGSFRMCSAIAMRVLSLWVYEVV